MIPFVIEFGSLHFDPLAEILKSLLKLIKPEDRKIEILTKKLENELIYQKCDDSFEDALQKLHTGEFRSLLINSNIQTGKFCCLVFVPNFQNHNSMYWYGQVEYSTSYEQVNVARFCKISGISFVSLSIEDTLDIENMQEIHYDNFPWEHWRLVEAYVSINDENKCLEKIRKGPAFKKIKEMEAKNHK